MRCASMKAMWRWQGRRGLALDAALAAVLALSAALGASREALELAATVAVGAVALAAIALRRAHGPSAFLLACSATQVAAYVEQSAWVWPVLAVVAVLLGRAEDAPGSPAAALVGVELLAAIGIVLVALVYGVASGSSALPLNAVLSSLTVFVPWWIGRDLRVRHERMMAGWERAAQLEREQRLVEQAARRAERARVASEMHDGLGHELSLIALTAAASETDRGLSEQQRETARRLRESAVRSVEVLHEIVDVLREPGDATADPADDAATVSALVERSRRAGHDVIAEIAPEVGALPAPAARAAGRVVQELLSNAARHAPSAPLRLTASVVDGEVRISAENPLASAAARTERTGAGLAGIAERAALLGGDARFEIVDGRFRARVRLPVVARRRSAPADRAQAPAPVEGPQQVGRRSRRARWAVAAVPVAVMALVLGTLGIAYAITAARVGLQDGVLDRLRLGSARAAVEPLLPPVALRSAPPALEEEPPPMGASCDYYRASDSVLDLSGDHVRLCFLDGTLVSKHLLEAAP